MMQILLVDSDPISRKRITDLLSRDPATWQVEECENGLEAVPALRELKPDVLICEVESPGLDGFSLLETILQQDRPATIFLSGHNRYAARAFDVSAADYILKPVREDRFLQALERAQNQAKKQSRALASAGSNTKRLAIRSGRSVIFVEPDELDWADAEGKYVRLHLRTEVLLLRLSISALEQELDPTRFVRIHRSTIVNVDRIRFIQPWNHRRTYQVTLQDGTRLALSRKTKLGTARWAFRKTLNV